MKTNLALAACLALASCGATAAPVLWGNVYTDLLVNDNATKTNSQILGVEGGVISESVELFGFLEYNPNLENTFGKASAHFRAVQDFSVYTHATAFKEGDFHEDAFVGGIGYMGFDNEDFLFKPYVGVVNIKSHGDGWKQEVTQPALGYSGVYFVNSETVLTSWADARIDNDEDKFRIKGSVGVQHDVTKSIYVGAFMNMNYNELGIDGYSNSFQIRAGYKF